MSLKSFLPKSFKKKKEDEKNDYRKQEETASGEPVLPMSFGKVSCVEFSRWLASVG